MTCVSHPTHKWIWSTGAHTRMCAESGEGRVPQQAKAPLPMSHLLGQLSDVVAVSKATDVPKWVRYLHTHMPIGNERMSILLQSPPPSPHTQPQPTTQTKGTPAHAPPHPASTRGAAGDTFWGRHHTHKHKDNNSKRSHHVHNIHRGSLPDHTGPPHGGDRPQSLPPPSRAEQPSASNIACTHRLMMSLTMFTTTRLSYRTRGWDR